MGYTTNFTGAIELGRELTMAEAKELLEIAGDNGQKFTGIDAYFQWVPADTLRHIVWDQGEKFYSYVEQLKWLCSVWLDQRGISANGVLYWQGEETGDTGTITVTNNVVVTHAAQKPNTKTPRPLTMRRLQEMALAQVTAA